MKNKLILEIVTLTVLPDLTPVISNLMIPT